MAELVEDYFADGWRERTLACPCGWEGDSRGMAMELHDAVTDYACPTCGNLLLIVSHPDLAQSAGPPRPATRKPPASWPSSKKPSPASRPPTEPRRRSRFADAAGPGRHRTLNRRRSRPITRHPLVADGHSPMAVRATSDG